MLSTYNSEITVRTKCMQKNEQQFTTKNSVLSSICYLFIITTIYYLIRPHNTNIECVPSSNLSKGAALFSNLVSMVNNNLPVQPLLPGLITSTDDYTTFVFKGKAHSSDGWYLLKKDNTGKQGSKQVTYSNNIGCTDNLNSFCIRLTVTINALGLMAAPFILVTFISR